ncbi:MAG: hypothetical protein IPK94_05610 [Saprospiraceae bacterium]|nr:hypothetical protein [Saprospiraceae bacterium]
MVRLDISYQDHRTCSICLFANYKEYRCCCHHLSWWRIPGLAIDHEGSRYGLAICTDQGIAGIVLKNRMPNPLST